MEPGFLQGIRKGDCKRGKTQGGTPCGFHLLTDQSRNTNEVCPGTLKQNIGFYFHPQQRCQLYGFRFNKMKNYAAEKGGTENDLYTAYKKGFAYML